MTFDEEYQEIMWKLEEEQMHLRLVKAIEEFGRFLDESANE